MMNKNNLKNEADFELPRKFLPTIAFKPIELPNGDSLTYYVYIDGISCSPSLLISNQCKIYHKFIDPFALLPPRPFDADESLEKEFSMACKACEADLKERCKPFGVSYKLENES